jgi:phage gp36-like protein
VAYATQADLYEYGLPRGATPNPGRLVASIASDVFGLDQHGLTTSNVVRFRAEAGGALPSLVTANVEYWVLPVNESAFSISLTQSGSVFALGTGGKHVLAITPLPVQGAINWASELIDQFLPAHVLPLATPIPPIVTMTCAELAIGKLLTGSASKSLTAMVDDARKRLERWGKGVPLRGTGADEQTPANTSVSGATVAARDTQGWRRFGGI